MILVFPQGKKGKGKNEKKHFSASALPRPQKPFFSFFPTSAKSWGKTKITRGQIFPQVEKGKIVKQNTIIYRIFFLSKVYYIIFRQSIFDIPSKFEFIGIETLKT